MGWRAQRQPNRRVGWHKAWPADAAQAPLERVTGTGLSGLDLFQIRLERTGSDRAVQCRAVKAGNSDMLELWVKLRLATMSPRVRWAGGQQLRGGRASSHRR